MKIYLNYGQHPFVLPNEALELMGRPRYVTFLLDQEGRKITIVPLKSHRTDIGMCRIYDGVYLRASENQRWALLQGLMDSDGCIGTRKAQSVYCSTILPLAKSVRELLWSLGIKNAIKASQSTRNGWPTGEILYTIRFTTFDNQPSTKLIRKSVRQRLRHKKTRSCFHYLARIEPVDHPVKMQCIQVDSPSHQYLAGPSMVPTHNSELAAAIPEETWELVQLEMERRRRMGNRFSAKGPLASRLVCADCGAFFGAKVWHSQDRYRTTVWRCNDKYSPNAKRVSDGTKCVTGHVTEEEVFQAFQGIVNKLIAQRPEVVAACEAVLENLLNTADLDAKKERLEAEQKRITEKVEDLMNRASREVVEDFSEAYGRLEAEMDRVAGKLEAVDQEKGEWGYKERQCRMFLKTVSNLGCDIPGERFVDKEVFLSLVDKVVVGDGLRFILRDGTEWKA